MRCSVANSTGCGKSPTTDVAFSIHHVTYKEQGLRYDAGLHARQNWQWYAVVRGEVAMSMGGKTLRLGAGDSIVFSPDTWRHPKAGKKAPAYLVCEFHTDLPLQPIARRVQPIPASMRLDWIALLDELRTPLPEGGALLAHALVTRILFGLWRLESRQKPTTAVPVPLRDPQRAEALADLLDEFMERRFREAVTRESFAEAFRMSGSQCARVYRRIRNKTLHERLTELRLDEAKRLLSESTLSVGDIAMEVGFDSFSHFSQSFRRSVGATPVEFRRTGGRIYPAK